MKFFDGRKIRDQILSELKSKVDEMKVKPTLAVFWIGENQVSGHYVSIKKKVAEDLGINFNLIKLVKEVSQENVERKIKELNLDPEVRGIMVQIPTPDGLDQEEIIKAISPEKDIDGLRYCLGLDSNFKPPVVLAILKSISEAYAGKSKIENRKSKQNLNSKKENIQEILKDKKTLIIGKGFLVGDPLIRTLNNQVGKLMVADRSTKNLTGLTKNSDIIISATGVAGIVQPDMIEEGAVLIDAGTSEISGELRGDIDPECYKKASYYTPVPGGIGPVTIAMLLKNLVSNFSPIKEFHSRFLSLRRRG